MKLVTENLDEHLFEELNKSKNSILIISPFISLYTAGKLISILQKNTEVKCTIVTRFDRRLFYQGSSSLEALKLLINQGTHIFALKNLHSKVYISDENMCAIGSANFTKKGLRENKELLIFYNQKHETEEIKEYGKQLIQEIKLSGNWSVSEEMINHEMDFLSRIKAKSEEDSLNFTWGAELNPRKTIDRNEVVLSVSVGGTYGIVEKYAIHAHPNDYPYKQQTKYITFRYPNGGEMKVVYEIVETLEIDITNWESIFIERVFAKNVEERLRGYILERMKGFNYEKNIPYKYYILNKVIELNNNPRPPKNNAGGWYYKLDDLLNTEDIVHTIRFK